MEAGYSLDNKLYFKLKTSVIFNINSCPPIISKNVRIETNKTIILPLNCIAAKCGFKGYAWSRGI